MNNFLVSVCIVTYNQEKYIFDCITSVIHQNTDVKIEILIGDDQSKDNTPRIIENLRKLYPEIIKYYRHEKRLGASGNYRNIIQKANGSFIAHLDGDDYWLPGKLKEQIDFMKKYPDCPAVYTNAIAISDTGYFLGIFNNEQPTKISMERLLTRGNFLNSSSMLYRSSLKNNIINMPDSFIDYRINLSHALCGDIGYINKTLTCYRVNSSTSILRNDNNKVRGLYWEALTSLPREKIKDIDLAKSMAEFSKGTFYRSIRLKNLSLFTEWLKIVLKDSPVDSYKMFFLILISITRTGIIELCFILSKIMGGHSFKILYKR